MSNKVKDVDIKNRTYYFFNDVINIKHFDSNNIKIDEKSYKDFLICYIGYLTIKDSKYVKIYSVNSFYLIFSKVNCYFKGINGNKYSMLSPSNENKEKIKKCGELWIKIKRLIRLITKNSDYYDEKYMKI